MPQKTEFREYLIGTSGKFQFPVPAAAVFRPSADCAPIVGLLKRPKTSWLICLAIIGVATLGKLGGTMSRAPDGHELERLVFTRCVDEHAPACELVRAEHRLRSGHPAATHLRHDGRDGAGYGRFLTGPLLNLAERAKRRTAALVA